MDALAGLGQALRTRGYSFITPTPETHRRVLARRATGASLRDVFGWSRRFAPGALEEELVGLLERCGSLERNADSWRSAVRYSTLGSLLCAHSAYPTLEADSVFFGPDTYRFAALLSARVENAGHAADVGCGSGAGGLLLGPRCRSVQLLDKNPAALRFARANAELNGVEARVAHSDVLSGAEGNLDLVVANPPYLVDEQRRVYRDGGSGLGTEVSVRIVEEALDRLRAGGRLVLYTGTPVVEGEHVLWPRLEPLLREVRYDYRELDPDVFGEELEQPAYQHVERIAVVALDAVKR
jgi:release factor glutamine methyltransferase